MLEELSTRLASTGEQKSLRQKLEQDLQALERELQDKSTRMESFSIQLDKEKVIDC